MEPRPLPRAPLEAERARADFVGTLVAESTSREFRLAVAREAVREQDLIAVDVHLQPVEGGNGQPEQMRLWAKVQRIERMNPLFPVESGHELAETRTNPLDTVLSFSREMVTAVCQVLGSETLEGSGGRLDHVRYPPQPASQAYRPGTEDIQRVVLGDLRENRALDLATLSNRPNVDVAVDGHAIVTRHLAILAMTGAGKSVTARRVVEELARKRYPIVIFDPHGDYTGLADVPALRDQVRLFYAEFPILDQQPDDVLTAIEALAGRALAETMNQLFPSFFNATKVVTESEGRREQTSEWLSDYLGNEKIRRFGVKPNLFLLADLAEAASKAALEEDTTAQSKLVELTDQKKLQINKQEGGWIRNSVGRIRKAAAAIYNMEDINRRRSGRAESLPADRTELVDDGQISVISLAGYSSDFQATIYSLIARDIFQARVQDRLALPVLFVLEEAHNFVPARAATTAEAGSIAVTKQIAQEGRKFGVGLILISQRPSRLDETTLAMCNSFIIMRMVNPADQRFVKTVTESLAEEDAAMLPNLDVGEAILSGQLINFPVLTRIKLPEAQGEREERDAFDTLNEARAQHRENRQRQQRRQQARGR